MSLPQSKSSNFTDLIKFFMSIFVVAVHAHYLRGNPIGEMIATDILGRIAVPFFFTAAGYFLFKHYNDADFDNRVWKYVKKMTVLYVFCTVLYVPAILDWNRGSISIKKWIRLLFFEGSYRQLWFLPALIFAVLLVFLLKKTGLSFKAVLLISVPFYIIGCAFHSFYKPLIEFEAISQIAREYYSTFGTTRNGLFFGFIYIALGALLAVKPLKLNKALAWILLALSVAAMFAEVHFIEKYAVTSKGMGMYISVFFTALFLFWLSVNSSFLKNLPTAPFKILRNLSMAIYFSHTMFLYILPKMSYNEKFYISTALSILLGLALEGVKAIFKLVKTRKSQCVTRV